MYLAAEVLELAGNAAQSQDTNHPQTHPGAQEHVCSGQEVLV
jgi:hypothetical protein